MKKCMENNYVLNKTSYPKTVTVVHSLILKYLPYYNSNRQSQYQGVSKQLMFSQHGKTGDYEVETKEYKQNPKETFTIIMEKRVL